MRLLVATALVFFTLLSPAFAQSSAEQRVSWVEEQAQSRRYWVCMTYPTDGSMSLQHKLTLTLKGGNRVDAALVTTAPINGREYVGRLGMSGWMAVDTNGVARVYLDKETRRDFPTLPNGLRWQKPNSTTINLPIVRDTKTRSQTPWMLDGRSTSSFGTVDMTCIMLPR